VLPTLAQFPTSTETPPATETPVPPSATASASATITSTTTPTGTPTPLPTATTQTILTVPPALPTATATLLPAQFSFGRSVEGADLLAWRIGSGSRLIVLVGGIHGGFEANTVDLVSELRDYFLNHPDRIQPDVALLLIPTLNPDALQYGRVLRGRFNANGVDLNRNWACGWSAQAVFRDEQVNAGSAAFSEPETTALGSLVQRIQPAAVLIYHGAANGIYAGECDGKDAGSSELGAVYGQASGYPYGERFSDYQVTGSAPAWLASIGIPALDIELATSTGSEFERNLRAVMAVQEWLQERNQEP
jgi:protein MpaA